ncbi:hypothetical protein [Methylobacterium iners]|uniref:Uncharacterized protein n=1 Tax=Methylobacterium iners TaxID=418707 RepID=A0ABQ4RYZ0_9HYPH|nr:hypothetical protein [Methylobacterium iners]GJD94782.1 hypothetical protein OCOJLMKI_1986 [Methylobacterium iners]
MVDESELTIRTTALFDGVTKAESAPRNDGTRLYRVWAKGSVIPVHPVPQPGEDSMIAIEAQLDKHEAGMRVINERYRTNRPIWVRRAI